MFKYPVLYFCEDAIRAQRNGLAIGDVMRREVQTTTPDALVADIMPMAAEAAYPIAVPAQIHGVGQADSYRFRWVSGVFAGRTS